MRQWKIGTRIAAGFACVIFAIIALGGFCLLSARSVRALTDDLASSMFPSVVALMSVETNLNRTTADLLQICNSTDQQLIDRLERDIADRRADSRKQLDWYEASPMETEEKRIDEEAKITRVAFLSKFAEVEKHGKSTDPAEKAIAQKMFETDLRPLMEKYTGEIHALVEINNKGGSDEVAGIRSSLARTNLGVLLGIAVCIAFSVPVAIFIVRSITRPLGLAVGALDRLAEGDMTASIDFDSGDEVGEMARSLNSSVGKLRATLQQVRDAAETTSASSRQLSGSASSIATRSQEQAASLEETSASMEQITATVKQSADSARQANQVAAQSRDAAQQGKEVVNAAVVAMDEINQSSSKISDIISTIDEIAFQTNLLAVNAAVEAARAGEQGRGFAVVASEVRSLAGRSANAAKEIKGLIQDSLRKVEKGTSLVNRSGETLQGIMASVTCVTDIISEIAAAAEEQSRGVEQVNTAITQMDQVTQANSGETEQLSSTAQQLAAQAEQMQGLVVRFQLGSETGQQPSSAYASGPGRSSTPPAGRVPTVTRVKTAVRSRGEANAQRNGARNAQVAPASAGRNGDSFEEF